ncbi:thioredoxin domain-containing protein [Couchioplanes caeruleus]|uniref:Uncharacterized protein n=2 Tax=Couchioplanes caeruleus TaxID=56438 RepID=A0A1K0GVW5_9ACTN|nr:hypothetical protein [Couchioplanes caeruleus]OJF15524.1 hypothetical protein BG844_04060 [Couchioplanes caeruleus subsp. caeruleus]ROP30936.1 hypothetical protein EDD30_3821 [Couchioplanes caeruleus]
MTLTAATPTTDMHTPDVPDLRELRTTVLRFLLALTDAHGLPMPADIGLTDHTERGGYRHLELRMDRNAAHDFHRWAAVLGLTAQQPSDFDLDTTQPWRALTASQHHPDGPFTGWGLIEVSCYLDLPARAQTREGAA